MMMQTSAVLVCMERLTRLLFLMADSQTKKAEEEKEEKIVPVEPLITKTPTHDYDKLKWIEGNNGFTKKSIILTNVFTATKYFLEIVFGQSEINTDSFPYRTAEGLPGSPSSSNYFEIKFQVDPPAANVFIVVVMIEYSKGNIRTSEIRLLSKGITIKIETPSSDSINDIITALRNLFSDPCSMENEPKNIKRLRMILDVLPKKPY